jgi:hypothetical protein
VAVPRLAGVKAKLAREPGEEGIENAWSDSVVDQPDAIIAYSIIERYFNLVRCTEKSRQRSCKPARQAYNARLDSAESRSLYDND